MTIRLDPATLRLLRRLARRTGRTSSQIIRDAIHRLGDAEEVVPGSGTVYEAMEHSIGCWDSGGARLSEATGEKFRVLLRARRQRATAVIAPRAARRPGGRRAKT
ncbi:MAG TPA: ribbon-helix-helix protein, CopG family [Methylomirabilota bacterium]|nr:ribbon-helix-helix protein, CopG family [Methylomirabilota bacterium]